MELLFGATVLGLASFLLYRRLIRATGLTGRRRTIAVAALVVLFVVSVVGSASGTVVSPDWARPIAWLGWTWVAVVVYLVMGVGFLALLQLVRVLPKRRLPVASAVLVVVAAVAVGYGTVEATRLHVVEAEIVDPALPAEFDGVRVALVSDLHVGPSRGEGLTKKVVDLVNDQHPDLVVLPGDLIDGKVALAGPALAPLRDLRAPLGTYAVAGNHEAYRDDVGSWLDYWSTLGIRPLRNESVRIERGGAAIDLAGVYDYSTDPPYAPDLDAALADRTGYTILLAHQPRQVVDAADKDVDLQLSGHTHGGQLWPFGYVAKAVNGTLSGHYERGGTQLYTTVGAGTWGPPVRIGARPEIVVLTLRTGRG